MKKYIMIAAVLISGVVLAQNKQPNLEAVGDMVKVTYHHDNGQVQQQGFYKNGKLQGKWVSFDDKGNKMAVAEYNNGQKVGTWLHWNESSINEVNYSNNRIASVKNIKKDNLVNVD